MTTPAERQQVEQAAIRAGGSGSEALKNMMAGTGGTLGAPGAAGAAARTSLVNQVYLGPGKGKSYTSTSGTYKGSTFVTEEKVNLTDTSGVAEVKDSFYTWDDRTLNNFMARLKKYGYEDVTIPKAKSIWDMAVDGASTWYAGSGGTRKVTPDQYIEWFSKDSGGAPAPTKAVYQYDPIVLGGLIDSIYQKTLGKLPTAQEKALRLKELQAEINKGTITKTVKDKSGMAVTTTTPGFSQEEAQLSIAEKLKAENPDDYDRQKRIDFSGWLSQNVAGA